MDDTLYTLIQRKDKQSSMMGNCQLEARNINSRDLLWFHGCSIIREGSYIVGLNGNVFIAGNGSSIINELNSHGQVQKTFQFVDTAVITSLAAGSW